MAWHRNFIEFLCVFLEYDTVLDIIKALNNGDVDGLLLDRIIANAYRSKLNGFKIRKLIDIAYTYNIFLKSSDNKTCKAWISCYQEKKMEIQMFVEVRLKFIYFWNLYFLLLNSISRLGGMCPLRPWRNLLQQPS